MKYFETIKIPTSHVFRNHLDQIHHTIEDFCRTNRKYDWVVADWKNGKTAVSLAKVENYLLKNEPADLKYFVLSSSAEEILYIEISNGVTINVKNGSFALYGLYFSLVNIFNSFKVPPLASFLRRYWVMATPIFLVTSGLLLSAIDVSGWPWFFWIITILFFVGVGISILLQIDDENFAFSSYILSTKISYRAYSNKLGIPFNAIFRSASSIVTLLAGISTIVTTIIFLLSL